MKSESPSIWWTKNTYKEMICPIDIRTLLIEQCCLYFPSVPIKRVEKSRLWAHVAKLVLYTYILNSSAKLSSGLRIISERNLRILLCIYMKYLHYCDSRVAQWKRAGPITQRSVDRNYALLTFLFLSRFFFPDSIEGSVAERSKALV